MRHQARLGHRIHQRRIGLDGINRRQAQAGQVRHMAQDGLHQRSQPHAAGQIGTVGGEVHPGQHYLAMPCRDDALDLFHRLAHRHRPRIAAPEGDDAKRTAMVAAVLDLHKGAGAFGQAVDHVRAVFAHVHDVVDAHLFGAVEAEIIRARNPPPLGRIDLFGIAEDQIDLGHPGEGFRFDLCGASRHDQPRARIFPAQAADGLARLAHRLARDRAGIHDYRIIQPRRPGLFADHLPLIGIEAAPEGDHPAAVLFDVFGHGREVRLFGRGRNARRYVAPWIPPESTRFRGTGRGNALNSSLMSDEIPPFEPQPAREPFFNPRAFEAAPVVALTIAMIAIHCWIEFSEIVEANRIYIGFAFVSADFWQGLQPYTAVTYALLHGSWMHLGFNMVAFFALGSACWKIMGTGKFFIFFALTAVAGSVLFGLFRPAEGTVLVGVSGVIFGLIAAIKRMDYRIRALRGQDVRLAVLRFIGIIVAINVFIGMVPLNDGSGFAGEAVAWEAHVGGFLVGWAVTPWLVKFWPG